jgi:TIR domain
LIVNGLWWLFFLRLRQIFYVGLRAGLHRFEAWHKSHFSLHTFVAYICHLQIDHQHVQQHIPLQTFVCYAHEDRATVEAVLKHLNIHQKNGLLEIWNDGEIIAGSDWDKAIKTRLESARIILMFISVDFTNSDYIEKTELKAALRRHSEGTATLIPIIVRACDWVEYFEIGKFQALPNKGNPILSRHFPYLDDVLLEVAQGIKATALDLRGKLAAQNEAAERLEKEQEAITQKAADKAERAERAEKNDEAAWRAAQKEADHSDTEQDKMLAYETYLEDKSHKLYRDEANSRIVQLKEEETRHKITEKKRLEAERKQREAVEEQSKEIKLPRHLLPPTVKPVLLPPIKPVLPPPVEPVLPPPIEPVLVALVKPVLPPPVEPVLPPPIEPVLVALVKPVLPPPVEPVLPPPVEPVLPPPVEPVLVALVKPVLPPPVEPVLPPTVKSVLPPPVEPVLVALVKPVLPPPVEPVLPPIEPVLVALVKPVLPPPIEPVLPPTVKSVLPPPVEPVLVAPVKPVLPPPGHHQ